MANTRLTVQGKDYALSGSGVTLTAVSITLSSMTLPDGVTLVTMADFGTLGYATLEPETSREENISFTGITQNANGTATLTGVTRGLGFVSPYTAVLSNRFAHAGGTICRVTNSAPFYNEFTKKGNNENISQVWTFNTGATPLITDQPVANTEAANKLYVDNVAIAGAPDASAVTKGITFLSVAPAVPNTPIAVGDNDPRLNQFPTDYLQDNYGASTTGSDSYAITLSPALVAYGAGKVFYFNADVANTGACTLNINGLGAVPLKVNGNLDPQDNYIKAGQTVEVEHDGVNFQILSVSGKPSVSQSGEEIYGASVTGNDTYVITVAPVPAAYVNGMVFRFKADVANTGAATLNVNGLGAISIVKGLSTPLVTGDILANQIIDVVYNSTGTVFQMQNVSASSSSLIGTFTNGDTTKDATDASTTQNIPHGLPTTPKKVRLKAECHATGGNFDLLTATTVYNGVTQSSVSTYTSGANKLTVNTFTLNIGTTNTDTQTGVVTVDATNIIITWTKTNNPTGTYILVWEAEA